MTGRLSPQVERLLDTLLDTYDKVEIVWHLASMGRLDVAQLRTRAQLDALEATLDELASLRLVVFEISGGDRFVSLGPRSRQPDVEDLIAARASDPLSVMSALVSLSILRVRSMAARAFADAFVLRPRKKRDDD